MWGKETVRLREQPPRVCAQWAHAKRRVRTVACGQLQVCHFTDVISSFLFLESHTQQKMNILYFTLDI